MDKLLMMKVQKSLNMILKLGPFFWYGIVDLASSKLQQFHLMII